MIKMFLLTRMLLSICGLHGGPLLHNRSVTRSRAGAVHFRGSRDVGFTFYVLGFTCAVARLILPRGLLKLRTPIQAEDRTLPLTPTLFSAVCRDRRRCLWHPPPSPPSRASPCRARPSVDA